ncbi:MAG: hypothetical protein COB15_12310, partial [Flavobacteriales bacterium]
YQNDSIFPFEHNEQLDQAGFREKGVLQSFVVDSNETVWMGFYHHGLYKISSTGKVNQMIDKPKKSYYSITLYSHGDKSSSGSLLNNEHYYYEYYHKYLNESKTIDKPDSIRHIIDLSINCDGRVYKDTVVNYNQHEVSSRHLKKYKGSYYLLIDRLLFRFKIVDGVLKNENISSDIFKNNTYSILVDDDYLWFCIATEGVYQCKIKGDSVVVVNHFLGKTNVSRVFKDKRNGYWFMTLNKGVYYLPSKEIVHMETEEKDAVLCLEIDTISGDLFSGFSSGKITQLVNNKRYFKEIFDYSSACYSLLYDYSNELLIIGVTDVHSYLPTFQNDKIRYVKSFGVGGYKSMMMEDDKFYGAGSYGLVIFEDKKEKYFSYHEGEEKIWCTSVISYNNEIWIGTKDGLRIFSNKKITNPFVKDQLLSSSITSMAEWSSNVLLIGTKNYGILLVSGDSVISNISEKEGLSSNLVKAIHVANQGVVWVGTNKGLSRIDFSSTDEFTVKNLTTQHGLVSEEINAVCSYKNIIYLATSKGLVQFDKTKIKTNTTPPPVFFTQFIINSEERKIKKNMKLSYKENFIKIHFEGLNYRSLGKVEYQYRMLGVDTNWTSTTSRSVQYPTLQPNDYQFEVKAKNEDNIWSEPKSLPFSISPPFWLTWWFISLEILFGIGIVLGIFWYREKQMDQKNIAAQKIVEAEKKMIELELKALRSQMNPHFIFNTLNSIQHYIAVNDFKSTNKYIVQFATLIRTILHLSEKNVITLQEEIDILTMYMDLEKMRFEEQFDYKIEFSDNVDVDYDEIPSMLLQPYVENAVWHGLMNKTGKGIIKIWITREDEYLCCSVEDNGIGREKAAQIKAKRNIQQKSIGMSVTKERLDLISDNEVNVDTIDLYDEEGNASGTKMVIRIKFKS